MNFLLNNEKSTLNEKIKHLKQSGSIKRKSGIGRPRTTANIDAVDELVLSQENAPQTRSIQYDRLREKRVFILLTQHQFVNNINVGGRLRCSWPATTRLTCCRSSFFQTLNKVVQCIFL